MDGRPKEATRVARATSRGQTRTIAGGRIREVKKKGIGAFFFFSFSVAFLGCPLSFFLLGLSSFFYRPPRQGRGEKSAPLRQKGRATIQDAIFFGKKAGEKAATRHSPAAHVERQGQDNVCVSVCARTHDFGRRHTRACGLHRASRQADGPRALPWLDQRACLAPP